MKVKWQIVLTRLKATYPVKDGDQSIDLTDLDITAIALQNHFKVSYQIDEDAESLDSAMAKKYKTLDSVVSSHTDGSQRSYNAMSLVMDVLKDLNSGTNDELDNWRNSSLQLPRLKQMLFLPKLLTMPL
jgi:hypothetical protein